MPDTPQPPPPKRRWFRYSLRTLLVVATILCVALAYWVHRANRQKAVVKWVEDNLGFVHYDFKYDEKGDYIHGANSPSTEWVQNLLGNDYLYTVSAVSFNSTGVKDLTPLAKLEQLKYLDLDNSQVSDLTPLSGLTSLKYLTLVNTQVTQEQINELKKALPNCAIDWSPSDKSIEGN